mgnify:CR=1 FL=1
MKKFTVLIADDHSLLRDGLRALLSNTDDLEVIGEAEDGQDTIAKTRQLQPDLVLLDLNMPYLDGWKAFTALDRTCPLLPVIVITAYGNVAHAKIDFPAEVELVEGQNDMLVRIDLPSDHLALEIGFKEHQGQHSHQSHWDTTLVPMV